jgi:hypothetical protein
MGALKDALFGQPLDPRKATRWGKPHARRELFIRKARIILQFLQNGEVDSVEVVFHGL